MSDGNLSTPDEARHPVEQPDKQSVSAQACQICGKPPACPRKEFYDCLYCDDCYRYMWDWLEAVRKERQKGEVANG